MPLETIDRSQARRERRILETVRVLTREQQLTPEARTQGVYEVCLLQQGPGNPRDKHYYTEQAIKQGPVIFESLPAFADHPDAIQEEVQPERSVKDMIGWYRNVRAIRSDNGMGPWQLVADLVTVPGPSMQWARDLFNAAVIKKAQDPLSPDLIGLSINATGVTTPMMVGDEEWHAVEEFVDGKSVDVVTQAGAGGRIVALKEAMRRRILEGQMSALQVKNAVTQLRMRRDPQNERIIDVLDKVYADLTHEGEGGTMARAAERRQTEDERRQTEDERRQTERRFQTELEARVRAIERRQSEDERRQTERRQSEDERRQGEDERGYASEDERRQTEQDQRDQSPTDQPQQPPRRGQSEVGVTDPGFRQPRFGAGPQSELYMGEQLGVDDGDRLDALEQAVADIQAQLASMGGGETEHGTMMGEYDGGDEAEDERRQGEGEDERRQGERYASEDERRQSEDEDERRQGEGEDERRQGEDERGQSEDEDERRQTERWGRASERGYASEAEDGDGGGGGGGGGGKGGNGDDDDDDQPAPDGQPPAPFGHVHVPVRGGSKVTVSSGEAERRQGERRERQREDLPGGRNSSHVSKTAGVNLTPSNGGKGINVQRQREAGRRAAIRVPSMLREALTRQFYDESARRFQPKNQTAADLLAENARLKADVSVMKQTAQAQKILESMRMPRESWQWLSEQIIGRPEVEQRAFIESFRYHVGANYSPRIPQAPKPNGSGKVVDLTSRLAADGIPMKRRRGA